jgi:TetR/AcrR family transcriptional regulator, transcriptional repressor for nem operon
MRDVKQPRALATRERIVRTAAGLFALKGFHDTKLEEIQRTAEVTTGAFFHHFQSKDDLGFAVIDRHMEKRRQLLDQIEEELPASHDAGLLTPVFRRLDAIAEMLKRRQHIKGGCVIGNLSTALSDTHEAFRVRLAECFDEMAQEFVPHLEAAARQRGVAQRGQALNLAKYIVTVIEGAIMQARTYRDAKLPAGQFAYLKDQLKKSLDG